MHSPPSRPRVCLRRCNLHIKGHHIHHSKALRDSGLCSVVLQGQHKRTQSQDVKLRWHRAPSSMTPPPHKQHMVYTPPFTTYATSRSVAARAARWVAWQVWTRGSGSKSCPPPPLAPGTQCVRLCGGVMRWVLRSCEAASSTCMSLDGEMNGMQVWHANVLVGRRRHCLNTSVVLDCDGCTSEWTRYAVAIMAHLFAAEEARRRAGRAPEKADGSTARVSKPGAVKLKDTDRSRVVCIGLVAWYPGREQ